MENRIRNVFDIWHNGLQDAIFLGSMGMAANNGFSLYYGSEILNEGKLFGEEGDDE